MSMISLGSSKLSTEEWLKVTAIIYNMQKKLVLSVKRWVKIIDILQKRGIDLDGQYPRARIHPTADTLLDLMLSFPNDEDKVRNPKNSTSLLKNLYRMVSNFSFTLFFHPQLTMCHDSQSLLGKYLEIFGRKNNLRDYWVTIGNEL